ncbi:hypothetical protein D3C76_1782490 [compost metagenome]
MEEGIFNKRLDDKFGYMVVITVGSYIEGRFDSSTITDMIDEDIVLQVLHFLLYHNRFTYVADRILQ